MKTKLERIEGNEVALEIEVAEDKLEKAVENAYRKVAAKVNVPGFRKGKVPRQVLEAFMGKEAIFEEALEEIIPQAYSEAVEETEIEPVSQPKIDVIQMEDGKPLIFKANVVVKPEVKLGQLTGLTVEVPKVEVSEDHVNQRLETMRDRYAKLVKVEGDELAEMGDILIIDFTGYLGEEPFPGGAGQDYSLELGSKTFIPGFEEQLVGTKTGEEKDVIVTFPEDYHAEDLKGKEARFAVVIKEIKKREVAALDDDFAKDVSDFETLDELKQDIRKNLEEIASNQRESVTRSRVVASVVELSEVDIPTEMIDNQVEVLLRQFAERLAYQGLKIDDYMKLSGATLDMLQKEFRPQAEQVVRDNLVLEAAAKELKMEVTDEDFEKQVEKAAQEYGLKPEDVRQNLVEARSRIEYGLLLDKTVEYLVANSTIVEVDAVSDDNVNIGE
ncbi:MAG: trigger factor [Candidatus Saccharibacteria bacterium]